MWCSWFVYLLMYLFALQPCVHIMLATYQTNGHKLNWVWWDRAQHIENQVVWKRSVRVCVLSICHSADETCYTLDNVILGNRMIRICARVRACVTRKQKLSAPFSNSLLTFELTKANQFKNKTIQTIPHHIIDFGRIVFSHFVAISSSSSQKSPYVRKEKKQWCSNIANEWIRWHNNNNNSIYENDSICHNDQNQLTHKETFIWCHRTAEVNKYFLRFVRKNIALHTDFS